MALLGDELTSLYGSEGNTTFGNIGSLLPELSSLRSTMGRTLPFQQQESLIDFTLDRWPEARPEARVRTSDSLLFGDEHQAAREELRRLRSEAEALQIELERRAEEHKIIQLQSQLATSGRPERAAEPLSHFTIQADVARSPSPSLPSTRPHSPPMHRATSNLHKKWRTFKEQ